MAKTPEGYVKDEIRKVLDVYAPELYYFMPVQRGQGKRGLDFHGTFHGLSFYVEAKAPGKKMTPLQRSTAEEMINAGAPVFEIDHEDSEHMNHLKAWLEVVHDANTE